MKKLTLILALAFTMGLGASAVTKEKKEKAKKATTECCAKAEKKTCCAAAAGTDANVCTKTKAADKK